MDRVCLTLALTIMVGCGGATEPHCRKIAKAYNVIIGTVTATGTETRSTPTSCSFDRDQVAYRCEVKLQLIDPNTGETVEQMSVATSRWPSLLEFLDGALPIGQTTQSGYTSTVPVMGLDAPCTLTSTYAYDDKGRPTAVMGSGSPECTSSPSIKTYTSSSTFDAWDSLGRYTHGRSGFGNTLCEFSRTIDDATNTIVTTNLVSQGCGAAIKTSHYDADGIFLDSTGTIGTQTSTQTYANREIEEICN